MTQQRSDRENDEAVCKRREHQAPSVHAADEYSRFEAETALAACADPVGTRRPRPRQTPAGDPTGRTHN